MIKIKRNVAVIESLPPLLEGATTGSAFCISLAGYERDFMRLAQIITFLLASSGNGGSEEGGETMGSLIVAYYRVTSGTAGGDAAAASDNIRALNGVYNPDSVAGVSVGTNQLTLPAGTYRILDSGAVCYQVGLTVLYLYNVTDTAQQQDTASKTILSPTSFLGSTDETMVSISLMPTTFVLAGSKALELRQHCSASATNGFGGGASFDEEIYVFLALDYTAP